MFPLAQNSSLVCYFYISILIFIHSVIARPGGENFMAGN